MAFTKCWLAYPEIRGCHCDAISLHTELTGETIDRAKAELAEGFKGLYGAALTEGDDITLALDIGKRRPDWDAAVLEKMGAVHCTVDRTLGRRILGELDLEHAPMFLVSARKA